MNRNFVLCILACTSLLAPSVQAEAPDLSQEAMAMIRRDFQPRGSAGLNRLDQDAVQAVCNRFANKPPQQLMGLLQADQQAAIKFPADGNLLGDWKAGEALAQSGRGLTWSDSPGTAVGGNCYNCHQLSPAELSFGTLGPSLLKFGKLRGNTAETQRYVYGKIYNAKAANLCSNMPRFGHVGALGEKQIKDLVALILDPESPVNK